MVIALLMPLKLLVYLNLYKLEPLHLGNPCIGAKVDQDEEFFPSAPKSYSADSLFIKIHRYSRQH
jgi:hypothetical protein